MPLLKTCFSIIFQIVISVFETVNIFLTGDDENFHHLPGWCHYLIVANTLLVGMMQCRPPGAMTQYLRVSHMALVVS